MHTQHTHNESQYHNVSQDNTTVWDYLLIISLPSPSGHVRGGRVSIPAVMAAGVPRRADSGAAGRGSQPGRAARCLHPGPPPHLLPHLFLAAAGLLDGVSLCGGHEQRLQAGPGISAAAQHLAATAQATTASTCSNAGATR